MSQICVPTVLLFKYAGQMLHDGAESVILAIDESSHSLFV